MTIQEKYSLAEWAMEYALSKGAQQAGVSISGSSNSNVEIRDQKIDKLEQSIQNGLRIRLFVDKKYSAHSTNRLNKEELQHFIEQAIEGTRFLAEDEFRSLPDPSLYFKGEGIDLQSFDSNFEKIQPQEKIELAQSIEQEILGTDERIISVTASYYDGISDHVMVTSNGFKGDVAHTYYGVNAQVSVNGGDARPESHWYESEIFFDKLPRKNVGKEALKRALQKVGQDKIRSERLPMIVESRQVGRMLGPVLSALNGSSIQQKNSFMMKDLDQQVFSEKLTIYDDPLIPGGRGSQLFDGEGLTAKKRTIFEKGTLRNFYIDTYYGKKLEMEPTSGGTSNLVFEPGDLSLEEMIANMDRAILVTGFNGGNCNGVSGDYSYGVEGFLVEDGKLTQPISEMNITGNMKTLWKNVSQLGNDENRISSWRTPSIVFNDVDFSGI